MTERDIARASASGGEIADMPDFDSMFGTIAQGTANDDARVTGTTHDHIPDDAGDATRHARATRRDSGERPARRRDDGTREAPPTQARRKAHGRRVTPTDATMSGIVVERDDAIDGDGRRGILGILGWFIGNQWVSFAIAALAIVVGMMTNRYVSVVIAILMLGLGYVAEQREVDDDAMPTYVAAMIAFFVPFIY